MAQSVNLSVSGIYTSGNDMNGLPPGALDVAENVESRYKNTLEPRRGFESLQNSFIPVTRIKRLSNFIINGVDSIVAITSAGNLVYYDDSIPGWVMVPGNYSTGIIDPDAINAKTRIIRAAQNLYITSQDGVRSLSSGMGSVTLRAGVPKALNLEAETTNDQSGFFDNNVLLTTTGDIVSGGAIISNLTDTAGIEIGQYVAGSEIASSLVVQDLLYTSELFGTLGDAITIAYTVGAVAGSEVVTVALQAVSVQIQSGVSTANQILLAIQASSAAAALVSVSIFGVGSNPQTAPFGPNNLGGGIDNTIPIGAKVLSINPLVTILIENGDTAAGSITISNLASAAGLTIGINVSGAGITDGAKITSISAGPAPYSIDLDAAAFQTNSAVPISFTSSLEVTMDQNANTSALGTPISFYSGSQVGYRMLFGRVDTDANDGSITRLGAASAIAIVTNITPYSTNVVVTGTLPKNSEGEITFVQLYRSPQTESVNIPPLDQYNLVYEKELTPSDFVNRTISITDIVPDSLKGIPLYSGSDREGILQSNDPPPMAWDMCTFRDFALYAHITYRSTLEFTIVSVGPSNGVQLNDEITINGTFLGTPFSQTYTAKAIENQVAREFLLVTSGTPSQNITDTAASLIRVINYDEDLPLHAISLSSGSDLPGKIFLESDQSSYDTFTISANLHQSAYDPELNGLVSDINTINNGIAVSKSGELEAVPGTNLLRAGDTSSDILRVVPLRDYVIVLKTDGIYKIQGLDPAGLTVSPFDLTTKIIGADTAVALNAGVWMLSNQGVVSISDGGVDAKSIPIDNQLNLLIDSFYDNLIDVSFAVGYESDRKYILSIPDGGTPFTQVQYIFNYVTNSWTTWTRDLRTGYVHSNEGKLYIGRVGEDGDSVSRERKSSTYRDYVDEGFPRTIVSIALAPILELDSVVGILLGDVIFQDATTFSVILAIDVVNQTVTTQMASGWAVGAVEILEAYPCLITWKQVFGENPAFTRQFSEGLALFKNTRFNLATMLFSTDFSSSPERVLVPGQGTGLWGLFPWGSIPWGGISFPESLRFYIPQNKQFASYLLPSILIRQGLSNFKIQGLSISYYNVSQEVGR